MPGGSTNSLGNIVFQAIYALNSTSGITTPSVGANTSVTATFAHPGVLVNDVIDLQSQTHVAGLSIASAWCATNGIVTAQFVNSTTGTIGAQSNYVVLMVVSRYENQNLGLAAFKAAIT